MCFFSAPQDPSQQTRQQCARDLAPVHNSTYFNTSETGQRYANYKKRRGTVDTTAQQPLRSLRCETALLYQSASILAPTG